METIMTEPRMEMVALWIFLMLLMTASLIFA
jgi:hypothetical protein